MNIYLDDNLSDRTLAALLVKAGHAVVRPSDIGLTGASDAVHLERAIRERRVTLTSDRDDFRELHQLVLTAGGSHPGILVVRFDNDPTRDMKAKHIVTAVGKLERAGLALQDQVVILNHWR
jgi:predicted nuclease of predicted toxin-antitoxin system